MRKRKKTPSHCIWKKTLWHFDLVCQMWKKRAGYDSWSFPLLIVIDAKQLLNEYWLFHLPAHSAEPHWTRTATSRHHCHSGFGCKSMSQDTFWGMAVYWSQWFSFLFDMPDLKTVCKLLCAYFLRRAVVIAVPKVHRGCRAWLVLREKKEMMASPGSPPWTAVTGWEWMFSCWDIFSVTWWLSVSRIIPIVTNGTVDLFVVVLWQMQNGNPLILHRIQVCMAWCEKLSVWQDASSDNLFSCLLPVFGETSERAGHRSSGQSRSFLDSKDTHTFTQTHVHISWCFVYLPYRLTDPAREHPEFQDHLDRQE